jgi:hypothetical protein
MSKSISLYQSMVLECPKCKGIHLHQKKVSTFWRTEDSKTGTRVRSHFLDTIVDNDMTGNPAPRRNGILINFDCEECDAKPILAIYQHWGNTYFKWESMLQRIGY